MTKTKFFIKNVHQWHNLGLFGNFSAISSIGICYMTNQAMMTLYDIMRSLVGIQIVSASAVVAT